MPRRHRLEVAERIDRDGNGHHAARSRTRSARAARRLVDDGVEAIAVCFLHAYRNPAHEREAAVDHPCRPFPSSRSRSRQKWLPSCGEYPRFVTTCANAYVQPLMARYLQRLERELHAAASAARCG